MSKLVSQKIVEMRKTAGYTQRDLAKKLGREHSFVARIEQGERRVDIVELFLICKTCDVSAQVLFSKLIDQFD